MTLELDRFNLEINASPLPLSGSPFTKLGAELTEVLSRLGEVTQKFGGRIVMIGILPTLRAELLQADAVTQTARFRALMDAERPFPK